MTNSPTGSGPGSFPQSSSLSRDIPPSTGAAPGRDPGATLGTPVGSAGVRAGADADAAPLIAGIGCTARAGADEIVALIESCLAELGLSVENLVAVSSHARKAGHPGLVAAARHFGVPLRLLPPARLAAEMPNPSARVAAAIGVPSVAEAAAAACGKLVLEKRRSARATCALAAQAQPVTAAMAASMLSTSSAGP